MMEVRDFQLQRLLPTLVQLGYDQPVKKSSVTSRNGVKLPFSAEIDHSGRAEWKGGRVVLFATDAYPVIKKNEEAVLHVWDCFGRPSKNESRRIADALTKAGIAARHTVYKGDDVVAFDAGEWYRSA